MKSASHEPNSELQTKPEVAEHIAIEASGLSRLATGTGLPMVAYLLEMAVIEAWREASEPDPDASGGSPADAGDG